MNTDWRVQIGQIAADIVIALGVIVLLALRVIDPAIGVALLGPLIGARAAVAKGSPRALAAAPASSPTSTPPPSLRPPNAGGALAIFLGVAALLHLAARTRGTVVFLFFVALTFGAVFGCSPLGP